MAKKRKPRLANRLLIGAGLAFYGNRYFKKKVQLADNGALRHLKPPFVVVANHSGFVDVGGLVKLAYPHCASFVISVTQLAQWPGLIKSMGVLPKKQFSVDTSLIRDIKHVLQKGRPVVIYPEAKLSVVGTPNIIKPAIAKLIKLLKVPLVTVRFDGSYLHKPRWAKDKRFVPVATTVKVAVSAEEVDVVSAQEIHNRIVADLAYDDYAYQLANNIHVTSPTLAEGLESILYKCPNCGQEFAMTAHGNTLSCCKCGASVTQNSLGSLQGGVFDKVTDWYAWQTQCVAQELQNGTYFFEDTFVAERLVGKKYVNLGSATITHNQQGITVQLDDKKLFFKAGMFYTLSFNNDFVFLPTEEGVFRFRRTGKVGCTTKLNLAVEQQTILLENPH